MVFIPPSPPHTHVYYPPIINPPQTHDGPLLLMRKLEGNMMVRAMVIHHDRDILGPDGAPMRSMLRMSSSARVFKPVGEVNVLLTVTGGQL